MRPERRAEIDGATALRERLQHVYWIGGGSGAGKSTIARRIAARYGLGLYTTDDLMSEHAGRSSAEDSPLLTEFLAMDMDERWLKRSPETMLETFHWFRGEGFGLIVEDLLRLPREPSVIVEGFRLLPHLVKPLVTAPRNAGPRNTGPREAAHTNAIWLLPTPEFRLAAIQQRGSLWTIAGKTSDPATALGNLLERDRMFTDSLYEETKRLDLPVIEVDTSMTEDELAQRVTSAFGL
ncbi:MAG TPA: shikimate kinase [Micromonosporaceae bacterium]|jgi:Shikimate kinase